MRESTILIPLPSLDFDPTEVSVTWKLLTEQGFNVEFATVDGHRAEADSLMLTGEGLDPWGFIPILKKIRLIGLTLRADSNGRKAYQQLQLDANFNQPKTFAQLHVQDYDGLFLPGGHAPNMVQFLENKRLLQFIAAFFERTNSVGQHKPIAAICHGVLLAARAISPTTGHSVLYGKRTTALTWKLEKTAWLLTKYFARFWDSGYYRTYKESKGEPNGYWSVEAEVKRALKSDKDFVDVSKSESNAWLKSSGLARDSFDNETPAWVVQDHNYLSGRWPGDAHTLAKRFIALLKQTSQ